MTRETNKFIELLKPNYNDAVKYCKALCSKGTFEQAEDILQDSLMQAFLKFNELKNEDKFRSWLFTIITRIFYSSVKRSFWKKFIPLDNNEKAREIPEIFDRSDNFDNKNTLQVALSKLSRKEIASILLFEIAEFSIEEIKEIQKEKSLSTIKSRLSRVRQKLKKYITEYENNNDNSLKSKQNLIKDIENETIKLAAEYKSGK